MSITFTSLDDAGCFHWDGWASHSSHVSKPIFLQLLWLVQAISGRRWLLSATPEQFKQFLYNFWCHSFRYRFLMWCASKTRLIFNTFTFHFENAYIILNLFFYSYVSHQNNFELGQEIATLFFNLITETTTTFRFDFFNQYQIGNHIKNRISLSTAHNEVNIQCGYQSIYWQEYQHKKTIRLIRLI